MKIERMKNVMKGIMIFLLLVVVSVLDIPRAMAGDYLGEFCWSIHITDNQDGLTDEGLYIIRLGISHMGGTYYSLQGFGQGTTGIIDHPPVYDGNATVVESKVYITLNSTQDTIDNDTGEQKRFGGHEQLQLDISTLSGTYWSIRDRFKPASLVFNSRYDNGTATYTACP